MKKENREFLDSVRHHYDTLVKAGYVQHLDYSTRENILRVIHEEFTPAYMGQLWCQSCIADMLTFAFVQYDKWIAENPEPVEAPAEEVVPEPARDHVPMTFPAQKPEAPATIHAEKVPEPAPKAEVKSFAQAKKNIKKIHQSKKK